MIINRLRRWWTQRILRRERIPLPLWRSVVEQVPVLRGLDRREQHRLRELASLFLHEKRFSGADGLEISDFMRVTIAAQACLLVLNLGLDYFAGWVEVIVYPGAFVAPHRQQDETGLVHESRRAMGGEAWSKGPVILSWADIDPAGRKKGGNVVLHEFAHKLDMLNGAANGMPPLHADMLRERWTEDFSRAYQVLYRQVEHHRHTDIDPYAIESPAEFFAVISEYFFEQPRLLHEGYQGVYEELRCFYRQDPLARSSAG